ncbi:MAG: DUF3460 family protein [Proteobacteria bacterium]|nr:DUF3460 family protein [Pseudomonadota bacterium]
MLLNVFLPSHLFVSEADTLLRNYLRAHPETSNRQKEGLQLWWDQSPKAVSARRRRDQESEAKRQP